MDIHGEFTPQITSWIEDRLGVNRITIKVDFVGARVLTVPASPIGIPLVRRETNYENGGGNGTVMFYYEGVEGDPTEEAIYELEGSFSQEPITSHPNIKKLMKWFGGYLEDGEVIWPKEEPVNAKRPKPKNKKTGEVDINVMYGVQSYYAFGARWTQTRIYRMGAIPSFILSKVGTISKPLGPVPDIPGRNWLEASPQATLRGNVLQVKRSWILSGIGGVNEFVYDGSDIAGE